MSQYQPLNEGTPLMTKVEEGQVPYNNGHVIYEPAKPAKPAYSNKHINQVMTTLDKYQVEIGRAITVIASVGLFIAACAVRGTVGGEQNAGELVVLGLVCGTVALYAIHTYIFPLIKLGKVSSALSPVQRKLSWVGTTKGSLLCLVLVLLLMLAVMLALPLDADSSRSSRLRSLGGVVVFLFILFISSNNRSAISWRTVWVGILLQFLLALFVLRTWAGFHLFKYLSDLIAAFLGYSAAGYSFLIGSQPSNFAGNVFPAIIFFCATVEILYYFGVLQVVIKKFATFFLYLMGVSGTEAVVAAASPFIGQGENALLVRPFVKDMTLSELHQVMTSGFATISGSVLFGYISLGVSPQALITAAIMSVPCAIALSKLRYPETEKTSTEGSITIAEDESHKASNALQALGHGAKTGMKICLIIAASLIAVLSALAFLDALLHWLGLFFNCDVLSVQKVLSYPLYPFCWLMGIDWSDIPIASELLALKLAANEFAAYSEFIPLKNELSARTQTIITYALCGFANFSSVGIQIGILGAIAPSRLQDIANLAVSAMLTGALSTCFSALTAGMLS